MNNLLFLIVTFFIICCTEKSKKLDRKTELINYADKNIEDSIPKNVLILLKFYPDVQGFKDNYILFKDGSKMIYDDRKEKDFDKLLNDPDLEDMFRWKYVKGAKEPSAFVDPGRIRNEMFFKKIYGNSKEEVSAQLTTIKWCPKLVNQSIRVTRKNNLHLIVDSLSKELDRHPEFKQFLLNIGGTFNWRLISGTTRLSMHSFGMTIDINTAYSNYWQWDCKCKDEKVALSYKNRIPNELVAIFEKYGFIWGGNWYHYDTMHFEYRPELVKSPV